MMIDHRSSNGKFINFQRKLSIDEFFAFPLNISHANCHVIGIWQLTIDHRFQTENLSIFRENLFGPRIFPLNELYFLRDLSSIIKKRIYHFLKKTFSIHGSKRVIFFTRSIIDHHGELGEFINFQTKTLSIHEFFAFPLNISHANCHAIRIWRLIDHRFQTKNL